MFVLSMRMIFAMKKLSRAGVSLCDPEFHKISYIQARLNACNEATLLSYRPSLIKKYRMFHLMHLSHH